VWWTSAILSITSRDLFPDRLRPNWIEFHLR
jgi:hypothetical protein